MPAQMEPLPSHQRAAMLDMNMLVMPGGRERTEAEYRAAGFQLVRILPLAKTVCVNLIEGVPA